jgi:phage protein D
MIYSDGLLEGCTVEVDLGYAEPDQHALIMRAIITKVEQTYPENGVPTLTLKGEDKSILMGLEEKKKVWKNQTVTQIVRAIAQPYFQDKVRAELSPDPMIRSKPISQDGKTDLAFLQELAQQYHAKCFVELDETGAEVLYFMPERRIVTLRRADTLFFRYRAGPDSNLISFSPAFDSSYIDRLKEVADVDSSGNTVESQEKPPAEVVIWELNDALMAQASQADAAKIRTLYAAGVEKKKALQQKLAARRPTTGQVIADQADAEATNDSLEARRMGMTASGSTFGNIWLRAKSNIVVSIPNERFSGEWYVSSVTHKIDSSSFKTDFKCVR